MQVWTGASARFDPVRFCSDSSTLLHPFSHREENMKLLPARVELSEANAFVAKVHRHHKPVTGHRFSFAIKDSSGIIVGVAICGRPVARKTPQRDVLEITRCATDGTRNACSKLYSMCIQAARLGGFRRVQTFTLPEESGSSLRACGFRDDGFTDTVPGLWQSREGRRTDQPQGRKRRWVIDLE